MGNGRAALGAEESVDLVSGGGRAGPRLDGAVDGQLVFGDDGDESWAELSQRFCPCKLQQDVSKGVVSAYSRLSRSGVGSHRSDHSR